MPGTTANILQAGSGSLLFHQPVQNHSNLEWVAPECPQTDADSRTAIQQVIAQIEQLLNINGLRMIMSQSPLKSQEAFVESRHTYALTLPVWRDAMGQEHVYYLALELPSFCDYTILEKIGKHIQVLLGQHGLTLYPAVKLAHVLLGLDARSI